MPRTTSRQKEELRRAVQHLAGAIDRNRLASRGYILTVKPKYVAERRKATADGHADAVYISDRAELPPEIAPQMRSLPERFDEMAAVSMFGAVNHDRDAVLGYFFHGYKAGRYAEAAGVFEHTNRTQAMLEPIFATIDMRANQAADEASAALDQTTVVLTRYVTEAMSSSSSAVEENAAAAAEMRSTTTHVTNAVIPLAQTAKDQSAASQDAARSTTELASTLNDIDATAQHLDDQAKRLAGVGARFMIDDEPCAERHSPRALTGVR